MYICTYTYVYMGVRGETWVRSSATRASSCGKLLNSTIDTGLCPHIDLTKVKRTLDDKTKIRRKFGVKLCSNENKGSKFVKLGEK